MKIGFADANFTPPPGLPLMGNFRTDYAARGVHDPLFARAIAFEDSKGARAAILSLDLCMLDRVNVARIRECVRSRCGLPGENLLVAATHTHSGPAPMRLGSLPKCDDADIEKFLCKAAEAVPAALANLQESQLMAGSTSERWLSFNRRLLAKDGATRMNWEQLDPGTVVRALGPIDPELRVLAVERDGRPLAAAVNFGLHPAILAGDNWLYSADYPGYLIEALERLCGPPFFTAFWNRCCGNVNHLDYSDPLQGRGYQEAQRIGYALAIAARQALDAAAPAGGGPVMVSRELVELKRLAISDEQARWCRAVLGRSPKAPGQVDGLPDEYYAVTRLAMYEKQHMPDAVEVMAIRLSDIGIVGLPGEMFCEYGIDIEKRSPAAHTFVIELANDAIGYLPTPEAFAQGGYEPSAGATFYTQEAGQKLTDCALRQLQRLFVNRSS